MKNRKRYFKHLIIGKRDLKIFNFLWKWKFLSTKSIYCKFFEHTTVDVCYKRLNRLKKEGYLESLYISKLNGFVWSLTNASYGLIKDNLGYLKSDGFKSENLHHDFWVTYCHLGEFLKNAPQDLVTISEQQLRRMERILFPSWLPSPDLHRPDGYWIYERGSQRRIIGLEVEISEKKSSILEETITFYEHHNVINSVIWILNSESFARRIKYKIDKYIENINQQHFYFLLSDIYLHGWRAKSILTENKSNDISKCISSSMGLSITLASHNSLIDGLKDLRLKPI